MLYCKPLVDQTKSVQNTRVFHYECNRTKTCQSVRFPKLYIIKSKIHDYKFSKRHLDEFELYQIKIL